MTQRTRTSPLIFVVTDISNVYALNSDFMYLLFIAGISNPKILQISQCLLNCL